MISNYITVYNVILYLYISGLSINTISGSSFHHCTRWSKNLLNKRSHETVASKKHSRIWLIKTEFSWLQVVQNLPANCFILLSIYTTKQEINYTKFYRFTIIINFFWTPWITWSALVFRKHNPENVNNQPNHPLRIKTTQVNVN